MNGPVLKIENDLKEFEVLRVLEFSGERKRMSVIIKGDDNKKILYCKGKNFPRILLLNFFITINLLIINYLFLFYLMFCLKFFLLF